MKTITLFSTDNYWFGGNYDEWQDEYNELVASRELPENYPFEQWLAEQVAFDWENLKDEIKGLGECVIIGNLGLWYGYRKITPARYNYIIDAIEKCINVCYSSLKIELNNGHLELSVSHHDGANNFSIYLLNKKGQNAGEAADLSKPCYHAKIKL